MSTATASRPIDPRKGDLEDDASSTKHRSLFALAGTLLGEISLPRLLTAVLLLLVIPGLLLGLAPIAAAVWISTAASKAASALAGLGSAVLLAVVAGIGWFGWKPLFGVAERNFWSLNALLVQPIYASFREGFRHLAERALASDASPSRRAGLRSGSAVVSGVVVSSLAVLVIVWVWPNTHLFNGVPDVGSLSRFAVVVFCNSAALIAAYLAVAALVWGFADATMAQPQDLAAFHGRPDRGRVWRVVHLSDIHIVGERYGFRIESGRSGPQGNERWGRVLARLAEIDAQAPLDLIVITGDMTDAGRSAEWAEFEDALAGYPALRARTLMLPGNHDVNIVDRANPARLDLPASPNRRMRQVRTLAALDALQGGRVRIIADGALGPTLSDALAPHLGAMARFMATGSPRIERTLDGIWNGVFPMVVPPDGDDGLGVVILNSNAITHFSFTNALGMIPAEQARRIDAAVARYPRAVWIVALHHHVVEYPREAKALSERIGTALINGAWFARYLQRLAGRAVVMHGHRHIDWIGECAGVLIVSAPSPVMEATNDMTTYFYVHTLAAADGQLRLLPPERVEVAGDVA